MKLYTQLHAVWVALTRRTRNKHSDLGLLDDNVNIRKRNYGSNILTVYDDDSTSTIADDDGKALLGDASSRPTLGDASSRPTFRQKFGLAMWEWRKRMSDRFIFRGNMKMRRKSTRPRSFSAL